MAPTYRCSTDPAVAATKMQLGQRLRLRKSPGTAWSKTWGAAARSSPGEDAAAAPTQRPTGHTAGGERGRTTASPLYKRTESTPPTKAKGRGGGEGRRRDVRPRIVDVSPPGESDTQDVTRGRQRRRPRHDESCLPSQTARQAGSVRNSKTTAPGRRQTASFRKAIQHSDGRPSEERRDA